MRFSRIISSGSSGGGGGDSSGGVVVVDFGESESVLCARAHRFSLSLTSSPAATATVPSRGETCVKTNEKRRGKISL